MTTSSENTQESQRPKGVIDKKFILVRFDPKCGVFKELNWWCMKGDQVFTIWFRFKITQQDEFCGPKKIHLCDLDRPTIIPACELTLLFPRRELTSKLSFDDEGVDVGWAREVCPGKITHRREGELALGEIGAEFYEALTAMAPKINGCRAIVAIEDVVLQNTKAVYNQDDLPPIARFSYLVFVQSKNVPWHR